MISIGNGCQGVRHGYCIATSCCREQRDEGVKPEFCGAADRLALEYSRAPVQIS
jgi:hypothetical protein